MVKNDPLKSKINWTMAATQVGTILTIAFIPEQYHIEVLALVGIFAPAVVQVFRTWFN